MRKLEAQSLRSLAATKAWLTRRRPTNKAKASERGSKRALATWAGQNGWQVVFFEGRSGAPRTGIVDAALIRIRPKSADTIQIQLLQLKSGTGGMTGSEARRLKASAERIEVSPRVVLCERSTLHFLDCREAAG